MYEVELKVRATHESIRDRLEEIDSTLIESVTQEDCYYNAPDRDFANTDEALRIRTETADGQTETRLTYKGPLIEQESKTRQEAETAVEDADQLQSILEGLGYEPAAVVKKDRERYTVDGCTVTLDAVDGLGEFVEAELDVETTEADADAEIERARDRLTAVLDQLGLDANDQIRTSYLGLLLEADDTDQTS